jgi:predicted nucleic-acid-binding Zn-ribbon protein
MRTKHVCPKCNHDKILFVENVPAYGGMLHVTLAVVGQGVFGDKVREAGKLVAYVCQQCGYTEFYARGDIPVDGKLVKLLTE